ncbi:MAG: 2,3,4,5-tetrahydropyridine-2,6-dicarboxylate N-succinyltransferase, partial [Steroidobacteraceae bacterium]|nr:2,3,4,5-tetrahydropyridine-2,6-dicarboxylate N-succinyltransferase [Steroidobacteraceae bacterium]
MLNLDALKTTLDAAFERRTELAPGKAPAAVAAAIEEAIGLLDNGEARVAEHDGHRWIVNQWLKKAVLLYFRTHDNVVLDAGYTRFYDKVPLKYARDDEAALRAGGVRVVPHAIVSKGGYIAP